MARIGAQVTAGAEMLRLRTWQAARIERPRFQNSISRPAASIRWPHALPPGKVPGDAQSCSGIPMRPATHLRVVSVRTGAGRTPFAPPRRSLPPGG